MGFGMMTMRRARGRPITLKALLADTAGNTMLMMAAAMIPIIGMAGSAFDMSRAYMVKTRLQQACDAGALAGRRAMTEADFDDDAAAETEADKFFQFNFPEGSFGTTRLTFEAQGTDDGQVEATAAAAVPMTLMRMFGTEEIALTVDCDARLELANSDVMMVLDVTGSMSQCPNGAECNSNANSKIVALRAAVLNFYDTVSDATGPKSRLRIGFVPYSSAVNVGGLLPGGAMVSDNWDYQSRVATMNNPVSVANGTSANGPYWEQFDNGNTPVSSTNCLRYMKNQSFTGFTPTPVSSGGPMPSPTVAHTFPHDNNATAGNEFGYPGARFTTGTSRSCRRKRTDTTTTYRTAYGFSNWTYQQVNYDVSNFADGDAVRVYAGSGTPSGSVPTAGTYDMFALVNTPGSTVPGTNTTWNGCVEERETVAQATYTSVPANAFDLQFDTLPTSRETRWRPAWHHVVYDRGGPSAETNTTNRSPETDSGWCPAAARRLGELSRTEVQSYVNSLVAAGNTYHDLGMAWAGRLLSPQGMFAADNATARNRREIARHIIFMTDGEMYTPPDIYNAHGYEKADRRVWGASGTPSLSGLVSRHNSRFLALCAEAKARNFHVWTIAFGLAIPPQLVTCADNGRSFSAANSVELQARFREIASRIAELRLAQ